MQNFQVKMLPSTKPCLHYLFSCLPYNALQISTLSKHLLLAKTLVLEITARMPAFLQHCSRKCKDVNATEASDELLNERLRPREFMHFSETPTDKISMLFTYWPCSSLKKNLVGKKANSHEKSSDVSSDGRILESITEVALLLGLNCSEIVSEINDCLFVL